MNPLCIYHSHCADGWTSAWIVRNFYGDGNVDFHPGVYQIEPPDVTDRDVILVDFSYKRPVLEAMAAKARSILILDHHKTAAEDLAGYPEPTDHLEPVVAIFDMERSGAQLTWDFYFSGQLGEKRPPLVDYIGDRDLWRWQMPNAREVCAYIQLKPFTFEAWDQLAIELETGIVLERIVSIGHYLEEKHQQDVKETVQMTRRTIKLAGNFDEIVELPLANVPFVMTSDAGNLMARESPMRASVTYTDTKSARLFSLRSTDDGPDVSAIAKFYGGGGHAHAAGFRKPIGWEGE